MKARRVPSLLALLVVLSTPLLAAAEPRTLRVLLSNEPPQMNSARSSDQISSMLLGHLMEGLTRYGQNSELIPGIAERWTLDDRRATFHLRHDAVWADGVPVRARDFVFAWRVAVDPKTASEYAFILYPLKNGAAINAGKLPLTALGVSAPDDWTLEIELEKPCGYFLGLTAYHTYLPLREDVYMQKPQRYGADAADLITNGPFTLTSWVHGASLILEKNPRYWNAQRIHIDRIEIPYITTDPNTAYNLFLDKKVDTLAIGKQNLARAQADRLKMQAFADGSVWYMEFNHREGRATRNYHLRKALQLVFDPKEYVSRVVGIPGTKVGVSLIPSWVPGLEDRFRIEHPITPVQIDLEQAKRELSLAREELGGTLVPLVWLTDDGPTAARQAEYFQYLFRTRLGIDLRIDRQIFKQRLAKMAAGDFDIASAGWSPDFADPMTFAELFTSWNDNNRGKYSSAAYDGLIRKAQSTADRRASLDAMAGAEKVLLDDVGIIPMNERVVIYTHQPRVSGIIRHAVGPDPDYTWATLTE